MDVLDSALRHEKEAIKLYAYLVEQASLDSVKRLFSSLLKDEQKHHERLANFRVTRDDMHTSQGDKQEFSRLFPHIVRDSGIEGLCKEEVNFYREVMECEKKGINQYEYFLSNTYDEKSKLILNEIVSQERMHFDIVKGLCVFISEQQSYR
jgi:rubrerythrin